MQFPLVFVSVSLFYQLLVRYFYFKCHIDTLNPFITTVIVDCNKSCSI